MTKIELMDMENRLVVVSGRMGKMNEGVKKYKLLTIK